MWIMRLGAAALLSGLVFSPGCGEPTGSWGYQFPPRPVEADERYLLDENTLLTWRQQEQDRTWEIRRHGWNLLRSVTRYAQRGSKIPVWLSWCSKQEVFTNPAVCDASASTVAPRTAGSIKMTPPKAASIDPSAFRAFAEVEPDTARRLVSSVHFDPNAVGRFRQPALETSDALNVVYNWPGQVKNLLSDKHGERRRLGRFPPKAIIVKPAWYVIPRNPAQMTTRDIYIWNGRLPSESGGGGPADSNSVVLTDFPDRIKVIVPSEDPCGSTVLPARRPYAASDSEVSLDNFFTLPICDTMLARDINDLNPGPAHAKVGDYLLLLGFHVITREIDDWVWSTFWWNNRPNTGPFGADRPQDLAKFSLGALLDEYHAGTRSEPKSRRSAE